MGHRLSKNHITSDKFAAEETSSIDGSFKILIQGTNRSGKTVILRQTEFLFSQHFETDSSRLIFVQLIRKNIFMGFLSLSQQYHTYGTLLPTNQSFFDQVIQPALSEGVFIDQNNLTERCVSFWNDPIIQQAWEDHDQFYLNDNLPYFVTRFEAIHQSDYLPSVQDILHSYATTSDNVVTSIISDGVRFDVFDFDSDRTANEPAPSSPFHGIIFSVPLSDYNQYLVEDNSINCLDDAFQSFERLVSASWCVGVPIFVILTKKDIFCHKIQAISLQAYFPEYCGPEHDPKTAEEWIIHQFKKRFRLVGRETNFLVCAVNAMDEARFVDIFHNIQHIIARNDEEQQRQIR